MQNLMDDVPVSVPVVFSEDECQRIIDHLKGRRRLMAGLMYGYGEVYMPYALARKYPAAASSLAWQFLFPFKHCSAMRIWRRRRFILMC